MKTIYIEVSGGVAELTQGIPGIEVEIIDWDNIKDVSVKENLETWSDAAQAFIKARYPEDYQRYFVEESKPCGS